MSNLIPDKESIYIVASVILYSIIGTLFIPGKWLEGAVLRDGKTRNKYKVNGLLVVLSGIVLFVLLSNYGLFKLYSLTIVYDHYSQLLITLLIVSFVLSTILYIRALFFLPASQLNSHGQTNPLVNFFTGIELNPYFFGFEIKEWSYRPGFILSCIINVSSLAKHYEVNNGQVGIPMILFMIMSFWYAADAFIFELGMIYMFDIIEENFGFMLVFGDYFWIPMVFSIQSLFLVNQSLDISTAYSIITMVIFVIGYIIFRGSNGQKLQFRLQPSSPIWGKAPVIVKTSREGRDLLAAGWWGLARKINYLGDIMIAIAMAMPCKFSVLAYLYPIYLTILLINRAYRDDARCREKYGAAWTEYCKRVKYIMIPYVW